MINNADAMSVLVFEYLRQRYLPRPQRMTDKNTHNVQIRYLIGLWRSGGRMRHIDRLRHTCRVSKEVQPKFIISRIKPRQRSSITFGCSNSFASLVFSLMYYRR
jgi:hypothetical protein